MTPDKLQDIFEELFRLKTPEEKVKFILSLDLSKQEAESLQDMIFDYLRKIADANIKYPDVNQKIHEYIAEHENWKILSKGIKNTYLDN